MGQDVNEKIIDSILSKCKPMLNDGKIPKFLDILI